ncbi:Uncharacterised protein [Vibrio cholerae]|nr:Uncharacterised protein [Vibrio cholerae]
MRQKLPHRALKHRPLLPKAKRNLRFYKRGMFANLK